MIMRAICRTARLVCPKALRSSCRSRRVFKRALKPRGEHVTDTATAAAAFVIDQGRIVAANAGVTVLEVDVIRAELAHPRCKRRRM